MNILTFDLEEWFVYQQYDKGPRDFYLPIIESYLDELLELLDRQGAEGYFFLFRNGRERISGYN